MLSYTLECLTSAKGTALTIALDATPLTVSTGGVARYTLELARALASQFPLDQYWLLSDQMLQPTDLFPGTSSFSPNLQIRGPPATLPEIRRASCRGRE